MFLVAFLFLVFLAWWATSPFYWWMKNVPSARVWPLIGSCLPLFKGGMIGFIEEVYRDFADHPFCGVNFTIKPSLFVRSPELLVDIMVRDHEHFMSHGLYSNTERDVFTNNVFIVEGLQWKQLRAKLTPHFTPAKVKSSLPLTARTLDKLVERLRLEAPGPFDFQSLLTRVTIDIFSAFIFSTDTDALKVDKSGFLSFLIDSLNIRTTAKAMLSVVSPRIYDLLGCELLPRDVSKTFAMAVNEMVEDHERSPRNDLLQFLIDLRNKESLADEDKKYLPDGTPVPKFTKRTLPGHAFSIYIAGTETTASTMAFCLYEMAINQDIQEKTRKEILEVLAEKDGHMDYEDMQGLKYTNMVIFETMRKYPLFNVLLRKCMRSYRIPGTEIIVEPGTPILIPIYSIHHDPKYYPEPHKFIPERFTEEAKAGRPLGSYLAFGLGPRTCIGMRFAMAEMTFILVRLLSTFRFTPNSKCQIPMELTSTKFFTHPMSGIWLGVEPLKGDK